MSAEEPRLAVHDEAVLSEATAHRRRQALLASKPGREPQGTPLAPASILGADGAEIGRLEPAAPIDKPCEAAGLNPEAALMARACDGDGAAFGELVRRHQQQVYGLCRRYLTPADADDAAQETFIRAFVHRERFDLSRPVAPWLMSIARRLCIDRLRQHGAQRLTPLELEPTAPAASERQAIARQELSRVQAALQQLAEGPREALTLFYVDNLAYREIAEVLAVPIGTVMTWLHRGRAELKRLLAAKAEPGNLASPSAGGVR